MSNSLDTAETLDICLLLRAHGEQFWMLSRVAPLVRQLELREGLPEEQLGAGLAYLELIWIEAASRAAATDAAFERLGPPAAGHAGSLREKARRYYAAVRRMRVSLGDRVQRLLAVPGEQPAREPAGY